MSKTPGVTLHCCIEIGFFFVNIPLQINYALYELPYNSVSSTNRLYMIRLVL